MSQFDGMAERYDAFCLTPMGSFVDAVERKLILDLLDPQPGEDMVDLGCGTGSFAIGLATLGCQVTAVDESLDMLTKARTKPWSGGTVTFMQANISQLSLPDCSFDGVLLQVTLEFVDNPAKVVHEAFRLLKQGGRLVIGLINRHGLWARHYQERARREPLSIYRHAHFWTVDDLNLWTAAIPSEVRGGLYVGPDEFGTTQAAWALERERTTYVQLDAAGFLAVRYDRDFIQETPRDA